MAVPSRSLARSVAPVLLLVLLAISAVDAARPTTGISDALTGACNATTWKSPCFQWLGPIPEASTAAANPRRLAELAVEILVKEGAALTKECAAAIAAPKEPKHLPCIETAQSNLKYEYEDLARLAPQQSEAKFIEARDKLNNMLAAPPGTHSCSDVDEPVIGKVIIFEDRLQVICDLLNNAVPPPPPPKEEEEEEEEGGEEKEQE